MIAFRRVRFVLYTLVAFTALVRLLLHLAAMPPYAGLDEIYHVARLAFVLQEKRQPATRELSVPPYLEASIQRRWDALPAFGVIAAEWPKVVRDNPRIVRERALTPSDLRPYQRANYEAQQASPYYILAAPAGAIGGARSALSELRNWRLLSLFLAVITVLAAAAAAERWFGPAGIAAAALIPSFPTWLTLVARAGNDALACALVAVGLAITARAPQRPLWRIVEAMVWAAAAATKLYTWPVLIVPILMRRRQAWPVVAASAIAALVTVVDLRARSGNALGIVAFDRPGGPAYSAGVDYWELIRVTIASAAWTSGEHWNAMTPLAIAICFAPLLIAALRGAAGAAALHRVTLIALLTFGAAQVFNVISCVLARKGGNPVPIGGKEGWYWYVLAPLVIPVLMHRWAVMLAGWIAAWDIVVHELALFRDYAGATSPEHSSLLFRWGPLGGPVSLDGIGVGPFTQNLLVLRALHLLGLVVLILLARKLSHDGSRYSPG